MKSLRLYIGLIAIFFIFLLLVLPNLGARSLWLDEGVTLYNSLGSWVDVAHKTATLDLSPPFYYYLINIWRSLTGLDATHNQVMLRLPSVFFALSAMWFVFLIARKSFNKQVGFLAVALLAINPFFIGFAQEARMYMLLTALVLGAYYFLLKIFKNENLKSSWVFFTIINVLGIYTHNFYWFCLAGLVATSLVFLPWVEKKYKLIIYALGSGLATLAVFSPWISSFFNQLKVDRYWIAPLHRSEVEYFLLDLAGGNKLAFYICVILVLIGFAYVAFAIKKNERIKEFRFNIMFLAVFCVFGFVIPLAYSVLVSPLLKVRYLLFLPPFLSILAAIGAYSFKKVNKLFMYVPLVVLLLLWNPWHVTKYPAEMNEDFAQAQSFIIEKSPSAPVVIHTPSAAHVYSFYQGSYQNLLPFPNSYDLRDYNFDESARDEYMKNFANQNDFWLLITHSHENPQGLLRQWSEQICPQVDEKRLGPIFLAHYECSN